MDYQNIKIPLSLFCTASNIRKRKLIKIMENDEKLMKQYKTEYRDIIQAMVVKVLDPNIDAGLCYSAMIKVYGDIIADVKFGSILKGMNVLRTPEKLNEAVQAYRDREVQLEN